MNADTQEDLTITKLALKQQANVLNSLLLNTQFMDVSLFGGLTSTTGQHQDDETLPPIRAHKCVLAAASSFFKALFVGEFADSHKDEYVLENVSHDILKLVVEAVYTGNVTDKRFITEAEVACDLLESFKYFLMDELASECENVLMKHHITVANCIHVWKVACKFIDLPKLTIKVEPFMAVSFSQLLGEQSFLGLASDEICRMMLIESIKVSASANARFRAVFAWLDYDPSARRTFSDDILAVIPLTPGKISRELLTKAAHSKALTETAMEKILDLLASSINVADIDFLVEPDLIAQQTSPASGGGPPHKDVSAVFCVGGEIVGHEKDCLKYDVTSKTWQHLKKLPWNRSAGGSCVLGDRLMLFGGNINGEQSGSVVEYKLSAEDSSWENRNVKLAGPWVCSLACSVGDTAYVCCGETRFFQYKPPTRNFHLWTVKSRLNLSDRNGSSIVYSPTNDAIYIAGGEKCDDIFSESEARIEKFDVKNDAWATVGFAKHVRINLGTALCGENLFLVGGENTTKSVETFNIRTGKAYKVPDLLRERQDCQAALLYNNVICVFGGYDESVEAFDVREGKWTTGVVVPDMPSKNCMFSLAWK